MEEILVFLLEIIVGLFEAIWEGIKIILYVIVNGLSDITGAGSSSGQSKNKEEQDE